MLSPPDRAVQSGCSAVAQLCLAVCGRSRTAEQIALEMGTAFLRQAPELVLGFAPFGGGLDQQAAAEASNGAVTDTMLFR